jgi:ribonucleoside-diphosphate reductase beta chain
MSVFDTRIKGSQITNRMFFDDPVTIARYDKQKYPIFEKLAEQQLSYFWRPDEIDLSRDGKDFRGLNEHEQHIFTSNLKRQILLDSIQGRAPASILNRIASLPEIETWNTIWTFSETIHSKSYSHIIRNIYSDPSKIFDEMLEIEQIVDCAKDVARYYDDLEEEFKYGESLQGKKALWLCLNAINALEGIRFFVSFACSWAFAELNRMEGNAAIIRLIARDESIHLASTQHYLKLLPKDDPDFILIKEETKEEVRDMIISVIDQEKAWADYLFKDGSMIGLNAALLCEYVEFIGNKRMLSLGVAFPYKVRSNPLPWTEKWISSGSVQMAPQEVSKSEYIVGGTKMDVTEDTFKGFKL